MKTIRLADVPKLALTEAEDLIDRLTDEADIIDEQLVNKRDCEDQDWKNRAAIACKIKRRTVNRLQQHVKELRRRERDCQPDDTYSVCFIKAARELLHEETFQMLDDMARGLTQ